MKLNDEQQKLVADNHDLIYWYSHRRHLDLEEWYDLLAIELCITCMKHNPSRGKLSTYYKLRCDNLVNNEYTKSLTQKRSNNGVVPIDTLFNVEDENNVLNEVVINRFVEEDTTGILKLKLKGYTQYEISDILGLSQPYISQVLAKMKATFNRED